MRDLPPVQPFPIAVYGLAHAAVDAACAFAVFSLLSASRFDLAVFSSLVILYNILAFGLQAPLGLAVDRWRLGRASAMAGVLLTAAALFAGFSPLLLVVVAGIGNALFHIGGGSVILSLAPGRAGPAGLYVAPGALGVLAGTLAGKGAYPAAGILAIILLVACIVFMRLKQKQPAVYRPAPFSPNIFALFLLLLLLSIAIRSFVGFAVVFSWKSNAVLLWVLTLSIIAGKGLGGLIADKFGWMKVSAASLVLSAPILAFGSSIPSLGLAGIFLFNITMPVTLAAIYRLFPSRPAFAFGIACMALLAGAMPSFAFWQPTAGNPALLLIVILVSAVALSGALFMMASRDSAGSKKAYMINY